MQGTTLYRLRTDILRNFSSSASEIDSAVEVIGSKEPSDGIKYKAGRLYWGALTESSVYSTDVSATSYPWPSLNETAVQLSRSIELMEWVDTFAVDLSKDGRLWFVSNRLDKFSTFTMDFSGGQGANMRVLYMDTN